MPYLIEKPTTLFQALQTFFPESSKRTLSQWISFGRIAVDGKANTIKNAPLVVGQSITLLSKPKKTLPKNIKVAYEDRWLIAIEKPTHLLSVASEDASETHAHGELIAHYGPLFPIHRLDREASGLLLFARGKVSEERFEKLFEKRTINRHYFAVIEGRIDRTEGRFESFLVEEANYNVSTTTKDKGKIAITLFEALYRSKSFSYLHLQLETGRKHQIRVHLSEAGHPIVGDTRYRSMVNPISRLALHAFCLEFIHPFTHKKITLFSELPRAFNKVVPPVLFQTLKEIATKKI